MNRVIDTAAVLLSRYYLAVVLVGIAAALAGWSLAQILPKRYTSSVYIRLDESAARNADALMSAAPILDRIIAKTNITGASIEDRRRQLDAKRSLSVAPNEIARTGNLFRMEVTDIDPARARQLNSAFLDAWIEATKPGPDRKAVLDAEIERLQQELKWTLDSIEEVKKNPAASVSSPLGSGSALATLLDKYDEIGGLLDKLRQQRQGVSRDAILSDPTMPEEASEPKPWRLIALCVASAEPLLLACLLSLEAIRRRRNQC